MICEKNAAKPKHPKLVLLIADQSPFEKWALGMVGLMLKTKRWKWAFIKAMDYATRWPVAWAVPKHTSNDVTRFIGLKIIFRFSKPKLLIIDGGPKIYPTP